MARAATDDELEKLRRDQRSKLFAAVLKGEEVWSARVNQATFSKPMVQVTYIGGNDETLGHVLEGMTVYVGSSEGAYDLGQARVRKEPTSTVLYIGETSEIAWADNKFLTVVREFALWQRHIRTLDGVAFMDYDVAYSDLYADCEPIVIMGPPQVAWLVDGLATIQPSSVGSWVPGSTIISRVWTAPGSYGTPNLNTDTPTIDYAAAGTYYLSCTQTAANEKVKTRWLPVFIFDADNPPLEVADVGNCEISRDSGGWDFDVSVYAGAGMDAIRARAMVVLFSQDWYGDEEGSIGPLAGSENVLAMGWIGLERITRRRRAGKVDFSVWGPAHWLGQMSGYPVGIENSTGAAAAWTQFHDLTVDAGLWHLATWRSTMSLCMDVFPSGDIRLVPRLEPLVGTVWAQLQAICHDTILADPLCDRYGRLFVEVPVWALPNPEDTDRVSVPVVMTLTEDDWSGDMDLEFNPVGGAGMVEASGVTYDGSTSLPIFSHAPGGTLGRFGGIVSVDNLLVEDQDQLNEMAGMIYAHENNPYPAIDIELAENNRMIDVAPRQRIAAPIATDDTPREIDLPDLYLLPTRISMKYDVKNGAITFSVEAEAETSGPAGITYIPPTVPPISMPPGPSGPGGPSNNPPTFTGPWFFNPPDYLNPDDLCKSANPGSVNGPHGLTFSPNSLLSGESATALFPCWIRQANSYGETKIRVSIRYQGVGLPTYYLEAIDGSGNPVLAPSSFTVYADYIDFTFAPVSGIAVAGFRLTVYEEAEGGYASLIYYSHGCQDQSWDIGSHAHSPDNSSYLGTGFFQCADTDRDDFHYWLALHLLYSGADLPSGHLNTTVTHVLGDCIDEWDSSHGFHFGCDVDELPISGNMSGSGPEPILSSPNWNFGATWAPGTTIDTYLRYNFGFHSILETCLFRIASIDWIVDNLVYANLYPGTIGSARRVFLDSASVYNICAP